MRLPIAALPFFGPLTEIADVLRVGSLWVRDVRGDRLQRIRDQTEWFDLSRKATQDNSTLEL